uniref:RRM domain-containing protein n=2 Tax=Schizaphis graminum TaxID=13262 RepID=A0A2S2PIM4_SCHGA
MAKQLYLDYQKMVKEFLAGSAAVDRQPSACETSAVNDDDDDDDHDDVGPTDRLRVDRLNKSITADQLYAAFSRYGKVLWVRIFPGQYSRDLPSDPCYPYHSANVCFERTESVDEAMADHRGPGCTIGGVRVSFSRSRLGQ